MVVLSLLAIFTLLAISYVLVASAARVGAVAASRVEQQGDPPDVLLDEAFRQVIAGSNNPLSVVGPHGLLEDMYGPSITGRVEGTTTSFGDGQMIQFDVVFDRVPKAVDGYYVGRVFTLVTGPAAGHSRRITRFRADLGPDSIGKATIRIMSPDGVNKPEVGDRFVVNGREFSGTGFGYNPWTFSSRGLLDYPLDDAYPGNVSDYFGIDGQPGVAFMDDDENGQIDDVGEVGWPGSDDRSFSPIALFPNPTSAEYRTYLAQDIVFANEDYDAADFQNMLLAAVRPTLGPDDNRPGVGGIDDDGDGSADIDVVTGGPDLDEVGWPGSDDTFVVLIPSLHRPALINYMLDASKPDDEHRLLNELFNLKSPLYNPLQSQDFTIASLLAKKFILRPLPFHNFQDTNGDRILNIDPNTGLATEPHFTGSNPHWDFSNRLYNIDPTRPTILHGPWDVDNDGDGTPDSVWVDLGLPVQTAADGTRYKPLFAILCIDMDGRLNLNAHGGAQQLAYLQPSGELIKRPSPENIPGPFAFDDAAGMSGAARLPFGQGMGTAEINLRTLIATPQEYANLLWGTDNSGIYKLNVPGRYGEYHLRAQGLFPMPGATAFSPGGDLRWGQAGIDDDGNGIIDDAGERFWQGSDDGAAPFIGSVRNGDDNMPLRPSPLAPAIATDTADGDFNYYSSNGPYGTPADLGGILPVGLDARGQPFTVGAAQASGAFDDPYELDLSSAARRGVSLAGGVTAQRDAPFTPEEMERLLRYFDADAPALPDRLLQLAPLTTSNNIIRGLLTSESWDTPTPAIGVPPELRQKLLDLEIHPGDISLVDLLKARLAIALNQTSSNPTLDAKVAAMLSNDRYAGIAPLNLPRVHELLAPELISGLRFDLNRPFGNNADDNGNGVVDEPQEVGLEMLWNTVPMDHNADGSTNSDPDDPDNRLDRLARQRYAKHLFVLAMLLTSEEFLDRDDGSDEFQGMQEMLTDTQKKELRIRRLAQWAVNVVDYRDRDAIMTPFEYDVNPFNGWSVDGDLRTENDSDDRRVVWGAEYPDLLITETVAGHDRRVKDLGGDDGDGKRRGDTNPMDGQPDDDDFDQERVPEGWTFVELYCTRNPNNPNVSGDLYTDNNELDLGRMSPLRPDDTQFPVWRLAVTGSSNQDENNNVDMKFGERPFSYSFQPERTTLLHGGAPNPMEIERYVWFAPVAPRPGTNEPHKIYYNRNWEPQPVVPLAPGHYAVVGPARRVHSTAGEPEYVTKIGDGDGTGMGISPQRLDVDNNGARVFGFADNNNGTDSVYPANVIKQPLGIGAGADVLGGRVAGFSISEPAANNYYPEPQYFDVGRGVYKYGPVGGGMAVPRDQPLDSNPAANDTPLLDDGLLASDTNLKYKTVLLQRLANPLLPWNPGPGENGHEMNLEVNPYITVDWMPVDLTVYNGEARAPQDAGGATSMGDPDDPGGAAGGDTDIDFSSRQRGTAANGGIANLWRPRSADPDNMVNRPWDGALPWDPAMSTINNPNQMAHHFRHLLDHTLGYLNFPLHDPTGNMRPPFYGNVNDPNVNPYFDPNDGWDRWDNSKQKYTGDPTRPFAWLNWPNRPFVSHMELLNVPSAGPARLLHELTEREDQDRYDPGNSVAPFGHLMNFFQSGDADDPMNNASNFHQLLEYVHVPSRFSGTQMLLSPAEFQAGVGVDLFPYNAPFNYFSRYREPGKVNINTIHDSLQGISGSPSLTWRGLLDGMIDEAALDSVWNRTWQSRQGYPGIMFALDSRYPTYFANPFRSAASAYNVPIEALRRSPAGTPRRMAEAGLLRPDPVESDKPLLASSLFMLDDDEYNDSRRNAYFHHQAFSKLGNLVTTRSNVYAVWITVGYFQVHRVPVTTINPDGYALGQELGYDTGDVERHRAFYLYDRTIPVASQRGETHNALDGLLIKRFIE